MKRTQHATEEDTIQMLDTVWTYLSISDLTIRRFVDLVRHDQRFVFPAQDDSDIQDILGYLLDCPEIGKPILPIPQFSANGVNLLNRLLTIVLDCIL